MGKISMLETPDLRRYNHDNNDDGGHIIMVPREKIRHLIAQEAKFQSGQRPDGKEWIKDESGLACLRENTKNSVAETKQHTLELCKRRKKKKNQQTSCRDLHRSPRSLHPKQKIKQRKATPINVNLRALHAFNMHKNQNPTTHFPKTLKT